MTGYKEALSVNVFHTIGRICCMEDTIGLGKFFTRAVTAYEDITIYNYNYIMRGESVCPDDGTASHLKDFHFQATI